VGRGLGGQALRTRWAVLGARDRALLLALLDALPAAAGQLQSLPNAAAWPADQAFQAAQASFKQARAAVRAEQFRSGLRRLLRR
jgi:hypothetical protein